MTTPALQRYTAGCNEVDPSGLLFGVTHLRRTVIFRVGLLKRHPCAGRRHGPISLQSAVKLTETCVVDTVQLIYSVFDNSPEEGLFSAWYKHYIGVIVRVPFNEGALAGTITPETTFKEGDLRNDYLRGDRKREVYGRVRAIVSERGVSEDEMAKAALCYVLSYPEVSTVIPGMRSVRNVEGNMAVGDGKSLPEGQVQRLTAHRWVCNFYA
jgi:aryl-alcohol dehydrogenase-like predicted oxidoreductase